jgi:hypothetical protein
MIRGNYDQILRDACQGHTGGGPQVTDVAERLARKGDRGESPREMRLGLAHIGVWSSVRLAFLLSLCLNAVTVVLIFLLVRVFTDTDLFAGVTEAYQDLTNRSLDLGAVLTPAMVWAFAGSVAVLNSVLVTAGGACYALLYNVSVHATGGVQIGFRSS